MFFQALLSVLPLFQNYQGPPVTPSAPTSIWIGQPDLSNPDVVVIPFKISNPSCCHLTTFVIPAFNPSWGTCTGTSVGLDWEVDWSGGIEYDIDGNYPWFVRGRMAVGWYPPDHENRWWPDDDELGTQSGNYWKTDFYIQQHHDNLRLMASAENYGTIGYALNDVGEGEWPSSPTDNNVDFAGVSGGHHDDYDGFDPLVYGPILNLDVTDRTLRAVLDCKARCCWSAKILGYTAIMTTSTATLHGEIVYER